MTLSWLPWAAWLLGAGLWNSRRGTFGKRDVPNGPANSALRIPHAAFRAFSTRLLPVVILLALLVIGGYARMAELWPQSYGLAQFPYDDEGVYAGASQLFLQGILPYRDYFFAHPPVAAISYAPALAYHFTEWGSPTSFMTARYLSVAYSLVTLALIFFIGVRLAGLWGGTLSGALWALDGRVVEINRKIMLDGPMVLLSCAALLLYLWVRPILTGDGTRPSPRNTLLVLSIAGMLATLSALTKIAGVACLLAIGADLIWLHFDNLRSRSTLASFRSQLFYLTLGVFAALLVVVVPFLAVAPSNFVRQVLFFQMLRPGDGLIDVPARIADLSATLGNALTLIFAAAGFILVTLWYWRASFRPGSSSTPWRPIVLWAFLSLLLFSYSRSFYSHYYIQLAAPSVCWEPAWA